MKHFKLTDEDFVINTTSERERASNILTSMYDEDDTEGIKTLEGLSSFFYAYGILSKDDQMSFDRFVVEFKDMLHNAIHKYDLRLLEAIRCNNK